MPQLLVFLLILNTAIFAQMFYELDMHYGLGASELSFNSVPGIAVSIYPVKNFGFSAGLEYSWRWKTITGSASGKDPAIIDDEGDSLVFGYKIDRYKEELKGKIFQVPLLLKYNNDSYYAAAGLKIGAFQKANTKITYSGLKTEGYYPEYNVTFTEPAFQGFGEQKDSSFKTETHSKTTIMLALEGGVKLKLSENYALLAGVFTDYSFNKAFDRNLPPLIERIENKNSPGAHIIANETWKSWHPWSVGAVVKIAFSFEIEPQIVEADTIVELPPAPPPPPPPPPVTVIAVKDTIPPDTSDFKVPPLPDILLNMNADFVFDYPLTRTSPSDLSHMNLIKQISDTLSAMPEKQLHCIGYSENTLPELAAYEAALQRVIRIRYTLTRFHDIDETRIFIYSQGSKNSEQRRAECFLY